MAAPKGNTFAKKEPNAFRVLDENTIEIELTKGFKTIIDIEDYEKVKEYRWSLGYGQNTYYSKTNIKIDKKRETLGLHQLIIQTPVDYEIDHIDGNGLNNKKLNLRLVTRSQNMQNRQLNKNNKSGHKGITWHKTKNKWEVNLQANKERYYKGFDNLEDAIKYKEELTLKLHGEYARLK